MRRTRQIAPILTLALLTGCQAAPAPETATTASDVGVTYKTAVVEFDAMPLDQNRLERAASAFLDTGAGRIDAVGTQTEVTKLISGLREQGVPDTLIRRKISREHGPWLVFRSRRADLPDCRAKRPSPGYRDQIKSLAKDDKNTPPAGFGCATQRNLGAMIADPADLQGPDTPGAASDGQTTRAIRRYEDPGLNQTEGQGDASGAGEGLSQE